MKYKKGQQLLCTKPEPWSCGYGPIKNEVVTFDRYDNVGNSHLVLLEYPKPVNGIGDGKHAYNPIYFEPLISDKELKTMLEEISEPQTA